MGLSASNENLVANSAIILMNEEFYLPMLGKATVNDVLQVKNEKKVPFSRACHPKKYPAR